MKYLALLIITVSLAVVLAGCSKSPPATSSLKNNDLGVIHISGGKLSDYTLSDGRVCTIMPALSAGGLAKLTVTIAETTDLKKTLTFEVPPDGHPETFKIDKRTSITVAPLQ